jgi:hypothetical protein
VAEWLRSGLQNRLLRFNSGRGLHPNLLKSFSISYPTFVRSERACNRVASAKPNGWRGRHKGWISSGRGCADPTSKIGSGTSFWPDQRRREAMGGKEAARLESAARRHHKPARHERHGRKEQSHFRRCQCPIVTHIAPRLLDDMYHQRFLQNVKRRLKFVFCPE